MDQKVYELAVTCRLSSPEKMGLIKGVILNQGISLNEIVELQAQGKTRLLIYGRTYSQYLVIQNKIRSLPIKGLQLKARKLKKKDWQTKYLEDFKPFEIVKGTMIIPSWVRKKKFSNKKRIYLETGLAFGTGLHPTTQLMAGFIKRCEGRFKRFLDVGTGTGILSLIALKCGAQTIEAIDISEDAIKTASKNFKINQCFSGVARKCHLEKLPVKNTSDFVAANLITHDLIENAKKLVRLVSPLQYLAISGIQAHNYHRCYGIYRKLKMRCLKVEKKEGWVAFLFRKPPG